MDCCIRLVVSTPDLNQFIVCWRSKRFENLSTISSSTRIFLANFYISEFPLLKCLRLQLNSLWLSDCELSLVIDKENRGIAWFEGGTRWRSLVGSHRVSLFKTLNSHSLWSVENLSISCRLLKNTIFKVKLIKNKLIHYVFTQQKHNVCIVAARVATRRLA